MSTGLSRRGVLLSLTAGVSVGLAGCSLLSSSDGGESVGCSSFGFSNTRTAPLVEVSVGPVRPTRRSEHEDIGHIELKIVLDRPELESGDAAVVNVYNPYDEVQNPRHTVPLAQNGEAIGGVREDTEGTVGDEDHILKTARVGTAPVSGEYRVAVEDSTGDELAAERFSFDCELSPSAEGVSDGSANN